MNWEQYVVRRKKDGKYLCQPNLKSPHWATKQAFDDFWRETKPTDRLKEWPAYRDEVNEKELPKGYPLPQDLPSVDWADAPASGGKSDLEIARVRDKQEAQEEMKVYEAPHDLEIVLVDDWRNDTICIEPGQDIPFQLSKKLWTRQLVDELLLPVGKPLFFRPETIAVWKEDVERIEQSDPRLLERARSMESRQAAAQTEVQKTLRKVGYDGKTPLSAIKANMQIVQQQQKERLKTLEGFLSVYGPIVLPEGGFMDGDCVDSRTEKLSTNVRLKLFIPTANGRYQRRDGGGEFLLVSSKGISMKGKKIKPADFNKTIGVLRDAGVPMSAHEIAEAQVLFLQKEKTA